MSRKYNCAHPDRIHQRGKHYRMRLARRGETGVSVRLESLEDLRTRQLRRIAETGVPWVRSRLANAA